MPETTETELSTLMLKLTKVLDSDDDYDARELFKQIFVLHEYEVDGDRTVATLEAGSSPLKSTPLGLYRLLFLARPTRVSFTAMYKSESLFALRSPDGHFVADIQTYKYSLALYFSASPEHIEGRENCVTTGVPGHDNGIRAKSPDFKAWGELLVRCLDRTWTVYSGNNFEV